MRDQEPAVEVPVQRFAESEGHCFGVEVGTVVALEDRHEPVHHPVGDISSEALGLARFLAAFQLRAQPVEAGTADRGGVGTERDSEEDPPNRRGQLVAEQFSGGQFSATVRSSVVSSSGTNNDRLKASRVHRALGSQPRSAPPAAEAR